MTAFTVLALSDYDPDSAVTVNLATAWYQNCIAIAEGDATVANAYRINPIALNNSIAGDYLIEEKSAGMSAINGGMTKYIEYYVNRAGDLRVWLSGAATGSTVSDIDMQVYKNGVAAGTLRTASAGAGISAEIADVSEDFAGLVVGDLLQIYVDTSGSAGTLTACSFTAQFCCSNPIHGGLNVTI